MRVLLISTEFPPHMFGGLGTHVHGLATGLSREGCKVDVFVLDVHSLRDDAAIFQVSDLYIRWVSKMELNTSVAGISRISEVQLLNRLLFSRVVSFYASIDGCPDVIHIHDWFAWEAAERLREYFHRPLVCTVHFLSKPMLRLTGEEPSIAVQNVERRMCGSCDLLIAVSRFVRDAAIELYGAQATRCETIYNGINVDEFRVSVRPAKERGTISGQEQPGKQFIVFAGRPFPGKGISELLLSARTVLRQVPSAQYIFAGLERERMRSVTERNLLFKGRMLVLGKITRSELMRWYGVADLAVVPSVCESCPYAALEPMSTGVPVIATDSGGLREIISHRRSGLLVPLVHDRKSWHIDVAKLTAAQVTLLTRPSFASALGEEGRRTISSKFIIRKMITETVRAYRAVAL